MVDVTIPPVSFTITVHNLTSSELQISVPYGGHTFRNFSIKKGGSAEVDRDLFLMGREYFQDLRARGIISYLDHVQVPCDEQQLACETGIFGGTGAGPQGSTGVDGATGAQGVTGSGGSTGIQGDTGAGGAMGATGVSGLSATQIPNNVSRYEVENEVGAEVWVTSVGTMYTNLTWSRTGTSLTVTSNSHGHAIGDRVLLRNVNLDYVSAIIASTTANTFTVSTTNIGPTNGTEARYSMGFTYFHDAFGPAKTGGTLVNPTGGEAQVLSMRIRTGQRVGTTYDVIVPASVTNGAGQNLSLADVYIPQFQVRSDSNNLPAVAGTIAVDSGGSGFSTFRMGNLGPGSISRFILLQF